MTTRFNNTFPCDWGHDPQKCGTCRRWCLPKGRCNYHGNYTKWPP